METHTQIIFNLLAFHKSTFPAYMQIFLQKLWYNSGISHKIIYAFWQDSKENTSKIYCCMKID